MDYISHSDTDIARMLKTLGFQSLQELIDHVLPEQFQLKRSLNIPECISELQLAGEFRQLSHINSSASDGLCFLGGGAYDHYTPAAIKHILGRSEFYTAYTPYQAEVAQGTLQTIYEFQTMVCRLMGMDAANASHYDGATALAEGVLLALRKTGRNIVVVPDGLNPFYRDTLVTYCEPAGVEIKSAALSDGAVDLEDLKKQAINSGAVVVQYPNFFGVLEPVKEISHIAHEAGALVVSSTYPVSLALLEPPGEWGADVATAEGQSLGIPMSFGGPYLGLFAVKQPLIRSMPGRLVARAKDKNGQDGFVLTLQTREQHIRREKATSNICTNQALIALAALVYLSLTGKDGLKKAADNSYRGAHYLAKRISTIPGCALKFKNNFFNEFVVNLPIPASEAVSRLYQKGVFVGPALDSRYPEMKNSLLVAVTEKRSKADMDEFAGTLSEVLG